MLWRASVRTALRRRQTGAVPVAAACWVDDSTRRVRQAIPGDEYQSELDPLLPATTGLFFHHYSTCEPSVTTTLQQRLNATATTHDMRAAVQALEEKARGAGGDKWELAHHRAISAPGAWTWKAVRPEGPQLRLSDVEYTVAARMNLGLQPLPPLATALGWR